MKNIVVTINNVTFYDDGTWKYKEMDFVYCWRWIDNMLFWSPTDNTEKAHWIEWSNNHEFVTLVKQKLIDKMFEDIVLKDCERE